MKAMVVSSLVHFEKLVFVMGIDQLREGGGEVDATDFAGTWIFFWVLAKSFAIPLYMDGFLNNAEYLSYWIQVLSDNLLEKIFVFHLLLLIHYQ
jgi:hypothetical protein